MKKRVTEKEIEQILSDFKRENKVASALAMENSMKRNWNSISNFISQINKQNTMTEIQPKQARLKKSFAFASLALAIVAGTSTFFYTHSGSESKQPTVAQIINSTTPTTTAPKELNARMYVAQQLQELTGVTDINQILTNKDSHNLLKDNTTLYLKTTNIKAREGDPTKIYEMWVSKSPIISRKDILYSSDNSIIQASASTLDKDGNSTSVMYHNNPGWDESAKGLRVSDSSNYPEGGIALQKESYERLQKYKGNSNYFYQLGEFISEPDKFESQISNNGNKVVLTLTQTGSFVDEQFRPTDVNKKVFVYTFENNKLTQQKTTYFAGERITYDIITDIQVKEYDRSEFTVESLNLPASTKRLD